MRANWNNISIAVLLVFVVWIFYKLSTYSSTEHRGHGHHDHHHHRHPNKEFTSFPSTISEAKDEKLLSRSYQGKLDEQKVLKIKLMEAREQIKQLKQSLAKAMSMQNDKMETTKKPIRFSGHKLVHLDLKGAPPKMPYLIKLLSYFKRWGATGLLVEYEDMFPYSGDLSILRASDAYSKDEMAHFLEACERHNLMVVPLVQSFGHFEFVLKHKMFSDLRETKLATNSLCPNNKGSVPLVNKMIDQVLALHPKLKYFHVGGDEVFNIKTCPVCMKDSRNKTRLFIDHMTPIFRHLKDKGITPLMWDDMMRSASIAEMKELSELIEPMVWGYGNIKELYYPDDMWEKYAAVFPKLWGASAFKGASKPNSDYVPIKFHLKNNLDWLDVIDSLPSTTQVQGIALTGWSRYDHYGVLCELLVSGLPSLAFCLKALNNGYMNKSLQKEVIQDLGLPGNFSLHITPFHKKYKDVQATFPGNELYTLISNASKALYMLNGIRHLKTGWMLKRQINSKFLSYQHIHKAVNFSRTAFASLTTLKSHFLEPMQKVLYEKDIKEWIQDKIAANIEYAKRMMKELPELEELLE